jgi:moderate conductance mechanosensitive channel
MYKIVEPWAGRLPWVVLGVRVAIIVAVGYLLTLLVNRGLNALRTTTTGLFADRRVMPDFEAEKRANTVVSVIRRPVLVLVWITVLLTVLEELGFQMGPLLAGAGVGAGIIGVAVGFGAQTLVKDMIGGLFLLFENQIRIHDVAVINGVSGLVEEINLRTTVLRSENGAVHVFPNGSITTLANLTREFAYYVVELTLDYGDDLDRVITVVKTVAEELQADSEIGPLILAPLEVMGVDRLASSGPVIKARLKTRPQRQWQVGRELNRRVMMRFSSEGIGLVTPTNIVRLEPGPSLLPGGRDELKAVIRELLSEMGNGRTDESRAQ